MKLAPASADERRAYWRGKDRRRAVIYTPRSLIAWAFWHRAFVALVAASGDKIPGASIPAHRVIGPTN